MPFGKEEPAPFHPPGAALVWLLLDGWHQSLLLLRFRRPQYGHSIDIDARIVRFWLLVGVGEFVRRQIGKIARGEDRQPPEVSGSSDQPEAAGGADAEDGQRDLDHGPEAQLQAVSCLMRSEPSGGGDQRAVACDGVGNHGEGR